MPAPIKPSIYPERYSARYEGHTGAVQNPSFRALVERLTKEQIACFDAAPVLLQAKAAAPGQALYLKTDTHWTPEGMEMAAKGLAETARKAAPLPPATDRFTATAQEITNLGDVAMMLKFPADWKVFVPETATVRQVLDGKQPWKPDAKAEVLFLGDSFANIFSLAPMGWGEGAGLAEHLSLALGLPVDAITRNDAGSFATREMLAKELQRGNDRLAGKKLVIWEFASRELAFGDWKMLSMALGEKREVGMYVPPSGKAVTVRGVVRAASRAPKPGTVPYKDHIIMVYLAEIESTDDPAADGKEAVVFAWSMRDNVQTPAARWRIGDTVSLHLRPWAEVAGKYEAINRSELDAEELLFAEPAWGEL
jgi:alginate O-acetyltransferase complex protein AlgJ